TNHIDAGRPSSACLRSKDFPRNSVDIEIAVNTFGCRVNSAVQNSIAVFARFAATFAAATIARTTECDKLIVEFFLQGFKVFSRFNKWAKCIRKSANIRNLETLF